jgi:hypothetical protein
LRYVASARMPASASCSIKRRSTVLRVVGCIRDVVRTF